MAAPHAVNVLPYGIWGSIPCTLTTYQIRSVVGRVTLTHTTVVRFHHLVPSWVIRSMVDSLALN